MSLGVFMTYKVEQGNVGEESVRDLLRTLQGELITGFFRTTNLSCAGRQVQVDFLVLVPTVGLLVLEVKNWKGTVRASSDEQWEREVPNYVNKFKNASLQVLRTSGIVLQMLEQERVNRWPIRSLVVFTNESTVILKGTGERTPQTDVIRLSMLKQWIIENSHPEYIYKFTQADFDEMRVMISKYAIPYEENQIKQQVNEVRI